MGRPTWATKEQAAFLEGYIPGLENAKQTRTLQVEYARISREFLQKWPVVAVPVDEEPADKESGGEDSGGELADVARKPALTPEQHLTRAEERRKRVSRLFNHFLGNAD